MRRYTVKFTGRKVGASGIFYSIVTTVDSATDDLDAIRLTLYDRYDHIQFLEVLSSEPIESKDNNLDKMFRRYVETALWSSTDDDGKPLDDRFSIGDIDHESLVKMRTDCGVFKLENAKLIETWKEVDCWSQAGIDLWLTRNGHGCGFWESEWGDEGKQLTESAKQLGESILYVGDDGKLYLF